MRNLFPVIARAYAQEMARRVSIDDLVGVHEIAGRLGVGTSIVHDWRRRHEAFPEPVLRLGMGLIWLWPEVERWARATGRLT